MNTNESIQRHVCKQYCTEYFPSYSELKLGIARNMKDGIEPINGFRHQPSDDTCGWFIYGGKKLSQDDDFFVPLHVAHIHEWSPSVVKFLGLPPGWRFLIAGNYEDVWFDESLLHIS